MQRMMMMMNLFSSWDVLHPSQVSVTYLGAEVQVWEWEQGAGSLNSHVLCMVDAKTALESTIIPSTDASTPRHPSSPQYTCMYIVSIIQFLNTRSLYKDVHHHDSRLWLQSTYSSRTYLEASPCEKTHTLHTSASNHLSCFSQRNSWSNSFLTDLRIAMDFYSPPLTPKTTNCRSQIMPVQNLYGRFQRSVQTVLRRRQVCWRHWSGSLTKTSSDIRICGVESSGKHDSNRQLSCSSTILGPNGVLERVDTLWGDSMVKWIFCGFSVYDYLTRPGKVLVQRYRLSWTYINSTRTFYACHNVFFSFICSLLDIYPIRLLFGRRRILKLIGKGFTIFTFRKPYEYNSCTNYKDGLMVTICTSYALRFPERSVMLNTQTHLMEWPYRKCECRNPRRSHKLVCPEKSSADWDWVLSSGNLCWKECIWRLIYSRWLRSLPRWRRTPKSLRPRLFRLRSHTHPGWQWKTKFRFHPRRHSSQRLDLAQLWCRWRIDPSQEEFHSSHLRMSDHHLQHCFIHPRTRGKRP